MNRKGFALIEMLMVTVILGLLVVIALPKLNGVKEKAYITAMVSDLQNLVLQQESYFSGKLDYARNLNQLNDYYTSPMVRVQMRGQPDGWIARARHEKTDVQCYITMGQMRGALGRRITSNLDPGIIECTDGRIFGRLRQGPRRR